MNKTLTLLSALCIWYQCTSGPVKCQGKRYEGSPIELGILNTLADKDGFSVMYACGSKKELYKLYPKELPLYGIKIGKEVVK